MKMQKGGISTGMIVLLAVLGFIVITALTCFSSYVSYFNYAVRTEQQLTAQQTDNRNILAQYGQKVAEAAQVPAMYRDDVDKVTTDAIQGRYGKDGSKATFQWLKEQNPNLDPKLYVQIQQIIEAGRDNFENGQRTLIDERRQYQTQLGGFWSGMWLRMAGFPKVDLKSFDIVSTDQADKAFKDKKEAGPIKLR